MSTRRAAWICGSMTRCESESLVSLLQNDWVRFTPARIFAHKNPAKWIGRDGHMSLVCYIDDGVSKTDIEDALTYLCLRYPSTSIAVHFGDDLGGPKCISTIRANKFGVNEHAPEIDIIPILEAV